MNDKALYFKTALICLSSSTVLSTALFFSLFVQPIMPPIIAAGLFFPNLLTNYVLI